IEDIEEHPEPDTNFDSDDDTKADVALDPPEIPPEISEPTIEGAEAAARYYIDALNYGHVSLDTEPLEGLCHPEAETCGNHIQVINDMREANHMLEGGQLINQGEAEIEGEGSEIIVSFTAEQEAHIRRGPD